MILILFNYSKAHLLLLVLVEMLERGWGEER